MSEEETSEGLPSALTYPKMNIPLVEKLIDWAEWKSGTEDSPLWNQMQWAIRVGDDDDGAYATFKREHALQEDWCGTAFCMCGMALQETDNLEWRKNHDGLWSVRIKDEVQGYAGPMSMRYNHTDWIKAGAAVLGLTHQEAHSFFNGDNTLDILKELARSFAARRNEHIEV